MTDESSEDESAEKVNHIFDSAGVCILCNRCNDSDCCLDLADECDQSVIKHMEEVWESMQTLLHARGNDCE